MQVSPAQHHFGGRRVSHLGNVGASGERLIVAGDDNASGVIVAAEPVEMLGQLLANAHVKGVLHRRTVYADKSHVLARSFD
jgi:hypothetical protein